ncbi:hypothetical protein KJ611_02710 [Patescibacteria group bacterium]|nr:hypothetical protein [Patescibacteria group bacterium]MBU1705844.1 hypothetical protein [Patescibacteria group bacterium]
MSTQPKKPGFNFKDRNTIIIGAAILVLVAFLSFIIGRQWPYLSSLFSSDQDQQVAVTPVTPEPVLDSSSVPEIIPDEPKESQSADLPTNYQTLHVDWQNSLKPASVAFNQELKNTYFDMYEWVKDHYVENNDYISFEARTLGVVRDGEYKGYLLNLHIFTLSEMGSSHYYNYLLEAPSGDPTLPAVFLDRYSETVFSFFTSYTNEPPKLGDELFESGFINPEVIIRNTKFVIPELEDQVQLSQNQAPWPNLNLLGRGLYIGSYLEPLDLGEYQKAGLAPDNQQIYFVDSTEQYFLIREDGRRIWYLAESPFFIGVSSEVTPSIYWYIDDQKNTILNTQSYLRGQLGGCGLMRYDEVVTTEEIGPITITGEFHDSNGNLINIYEPVDYGSEYFTYYFQSWQYVHGEDKTIEEFAQTHPAFIWRDSQGRLILSHSTDARPMAECGKPVIYLYPEETTEISVELEPQGGFSITEPEYYDGWQVIAHPDGTLFNKVDGQEYPYLFWEGIGGLYSSPEQNWVVAKNDVESFLNEKLAVLGLNQKETADFMEFWYPRMQAAPYYRIGFHGTHVMDQIAPLSLSVKPDMTLRILMDYQELDAPEPANPPILPPTPKHHGFSVIEWGGVLR